MQVFLDFITRCDWCGEYVGTENLTEFHDKENESYYYFCKDCMKKVRKIRRDRLKAERENEQKKEEKEAPG